MFGKRWADQITPFVTGTAIALVILATVVSRGWAAIQPGDCGRCIAYYQHKAKNNNSICNKNQNPYKWHSCVVQYSDSKCYPSICGQPATEPEDTTVDYSSDGCDQYPEDDDLSLCNWKCWNRECVTNGTTNVCADRQVPCEGTPSTDCAECRCNP